MLFKICEKHVMRLFRHVIKNRTNFFGYLIICEFEGNFSDAGGTCVDAFACKGLGKVCGGFANFKCCDDLICKLEGDFPDAGGKCVKADKPCI